MTERAVRWFRVSSDKQDEKNQVRDVDAHCAARGFDVVEKVFRLHDVSASKGEQEPALQEVLADIKAGAYSVVVVAHSSRLDRRDPDVQMFYALSVRMAGGRIESAREPEFGQASLSGRVVTLLAQQGNHDYSKTLAGNIRAAHARIDADAAFRGKPPWGLTAEGPKYAKRLVATETGRTWIPSIFAKVIEGWSLAAVARWLEAEGVPPQGVAKESSAKGKTGKWWPRVLGSMIRNTAYMGYYYHQSEAGAVLHRCEALTDAATFRAAGEALDGRPKRGPQVAENRAALAGVLFCGNPDCTAGGGDSPMYRIHPKQGLFYRCAGRGADRKGCGNMVPLEAADARFREWAAAELGDLPVGSYELIPGRDHKAELEALRFEMKQLGARDLPWEEEDAERARLRAEYERVKLLPVEKDRWIFTRGDETHARRWASLRGDQPDYLRRELEIRVTARRDNDAECGVHIDVECGAKMWQEALDRAESEIDQEKRGKAMAAAYLKDWEETQE